MNIFRKSTTIDVGLPLLATGRPIQVDNRLNLIIGIRRGQQNTSADNNWRRMSASRDLRLPPYIGRCIPHHGQRRTDRRNPITIGTTPTQPVAIDFRNDSRRYSRSKLDTHKKKTERWEPSLRDSLHILVARGVRCSWCAIFNRNSSLHTEVTKDTSPIGLQTMI